MVVIRATASGSCPTRFCGAACSTGSSFRRPRSCSRILQERLGHLNLSQQLVESAVRKFNEVRGLAGLEKKPATGELLAWVRVLQATGVQHAELDRLAPRDLPAQSALLKSDQDAKLLAGPPAR